MSAQSLSEVVYRHIFPGGTIPFACKDKLPALDARIKKLDDLVQTLFVPTSQEGRGNLPEAKPEQSESTTVRNSRTVQESTDVRKLKLSDLEGGKGPLSQAQKDQILEMHVAGKSYDEIKQALGIDGRRIVGVCRGQEHRERMAALFPTRPSGPQNATSVQQEAPKDQSFPGVEGAQEAARANPRGTPEEKQSAPSKPDPKLDYYEVADAKIINMKKRKMLNHEIAQSLERNPGGSWTTQKVDARWTDLKRQGLT